MKFCGVGCPEHINIGNKCVLTLFPIFISPVYPYGRHRVAPTWKFLFIYIASNIYMFLELQDGPVGAGLSSPTPNPEYVNTGNNINTQTIHSQPRNPENINTGSYFHARNKNVGAI